MIDELVLEYFLEFMIQYVFWNKKSKCCHDPGVIDIDVFIGVTNFILEHISVITEDIYFKLLTYFHYQKSNLIPSKEITQYIFARIMPLF